MVKYLYYGFFIFLVTAGLYLGYKRPWAGLMACLFVLPYDRLGVDTLKMDVNTLFLLACFAGCFIRCRWGMFRNLRYAWFIYLMSVWLIICLAISLRTGDYAQYRLADGGSIDPVYAATRHFYFIGGAFLFYVFSSYVLLRWPLWDKYLVSFAASTFYYALTYVLSYRLHLNVPQPLQTVYSDESLTPAFSGYGSSGLLGEYAITVIAFAITLLRFLKIPKLYKMMAGISVILSIQFIISTSSRAALVGLIILVCLLCFNRGWGSWDSLKQAFIPAVLIVLAFFLIPMLPDYYEVKEKITGTMDNIHAPGGSDFDTLFNRTYKADLPEIARVSGWTGVGPFYADKLNDHILVSHTVYVNWIAKIGFIGLALYLILLSKIALDLWKCRRNVGEQNRRLAWMLLILLPVLLVNQCFHSYEMTSSAAARMWFLFAMAGVLATSGDRPPRMPGPLCRTRDRQVRNRARNVPSVWAARFQS